MINDLVVNRVEPVDEISRSEIGKKYQSHSSGLNFDEMLVAEVLKNKTPEEKELLVGKKEPIQNPSHQDRLDEARMAIANSFTLMSSFIKERNLKKKEEDRGRK